MVARGAGVRQLGGMAPLSEDHFRTRLVEELERVTRSVRSASSAGRELIEDVCRPGGPPPLSSLAEQRMLSELQERDARRVRELVDALRRLDRGEYGRCTTCGASIEDVRLDLMPDTKACAACASTPSA